MAVSEEAYFGVEQLGPPGTTREGHVASHDISNLITVTSTIPGQQFGSMHIRFKI
jgi:hypothetical protein